MRWFVLSVFLACYSLQASAAIKPCEELKEEIAAKIEAKGVKSYELTIVKNEETENDRMVEGKIVGSCEDGTKKIIYTKNRKPAERDTAAE